MWPGCAKEVDWVNEYQSAAGVKRRIRGVQRRICGLADIGVANRILPIPDWQGEEDKYMILIIGPAFSGKREYARSIMEGRMRSDQRIEVQEIITVETDLQIEVQEMITVETDLQIEVQEMITDETNPEELESIASDLCSEAKVLTASETGAGIVPVDPKDRRRRELQGKFLSLLAARADRVIRVFYGIPEVLKG